MNPLDPKGNDYFDNISDMYPYDDQQHQQPQWTQEDLDELVKQYRLGHPAPGEEVLANPKHLLEHWQDYLSLLVLLVTLVDHFRPAWCSVTYWWGSCKSLGGPLSIRADLTDSEVMPILPTHDEETGLAVKRHNKGKNSKKRRKYNKKDFGLSKRQSASCCGPRRGGGTVKDNRGTPAIQKAAPTGVNMYDIAKVWAVLAMICDHYGYFGIPGPSYDAARWTRVVGRMAAPLFFFLSGFSSNYRFRWRTWCWGLFLFLCNAWLRIRLTHTSWESLITILFINWLFAYVPLHRIKAASYGWIWHLAIFLGLYYSKDYMSNTLRWAYGSLPYEIAIAGMMVRHKHPLAKAWCACVMWHYCSISVAVFSTGRYMTMWIMTLVTIDTLVFMFFHQLVALGEFAFFDKTGPVKQLLLYFSRHALLIYVVHLMLFRLIQLLKWSWEE